MVTDKTKIIYRITIAIACIIGLDLIVMLLAGIGDDTQLTFATVWHAMSQFINIILAIFIIKRGEGSSIALATVFMIISVGALFLMAAGMIAGLSFA